IESASPPLLAACPSLGRGVIRVPRVGQGFEQACITTGPTTVIRRGRALAGGAAWILLARRGWPSRPPHGRNSCRWVSVQAKALWMATCRSQKVYSPGTWRDSIARRDSGFGSREIPAAAKDCEKSPAASYARLAVPGHP